MQVSGERTNVIVTTLADVVVVSGGAMMRAKTFHTKKEQIGMSLHYYETIKLTWDKSRTHDQLDPTTCVCNECDRKLFLFESRK